MDKYLKKEEARKPPMVQHASAEACASKKSDRIVPPAHQDYGNKLNSSHNTRTIRHVSSNLSERFVRPAANVLLSGRTRQGYR
jgi:hypothetical protein